MLISSSAVAEGMNANASVNKIIRAGIVDIIACPEVAKQDRVGVRRGGDDQE